jgi:hypothetical protein
MRAIADWVGSLLRQGAQLSGLWHELFGDGIIVDRTADEPSHLRRDRNRIARAHRTQVVG